MSTNELALRRRIAELEAKVGSMETDAARYRALLKARHDLIVELDHLGLIQMISPAMMELSGFSASDCIGRSTFEFTTPEHAQRLLAECPTAFDWAARRLPFEIPLVCKNGAEVWLEGNIYAYTSESGESGMFCLYRDISESRLLERENRRLGEGAAMALEISGTETYEYDTLEGMVWHSAGLARLFGISETQAYSSDLNRWLERVHPDDQHIIQKRVVQARANNGRVPAVLVRMMMPDGGIRIIQSSAHYEFNADGSIKRIIGGVRDATAEITAQERLDQLNERLSLALEISEIGMSRWSTNLSHPVCDARYRQVLGLADSEAPPTKEEFIARVHQDDRAQVAEHIRQSLISGRSSLQRYRYLRSDGVMIHMESAARYHLNAQGEVISALAIVRDVSSIEAIRESLQQSRVQLQFVEERAIVNATQLSQILETAEEGIVVTDLKGFITFNNPKFEQIFGYQTDELAGQHESILLPDDQAAHFEQRLRDRTLGVSESYTHNFKRKNGTRINCWVNAKPLLDTDRQPTAILAMLTDVSDLERSERELRQSIEWLEFSMESAQIAGMDLDIENETVRTTILFREWFGQPESCDLTTAKSWSEQALEEDRATLLAKLEQILQSGSSGELEFRYVNERGIVQWLYAVVVCIRHQGQVTRVVLTIVDISARRELELDRQLLQSQLAQTLREESLSTLASGMAHDLNNLLTTAFGHIDLARMINSDPEAENSLSLVGESLTQMTKLSNQMLAYSGKSPFSIRSQDLNEIMDGMRSIFSVSVGKKARFRMELYPGRLEIEGDANALQQVAISLLLNATEALQKQGGEIELRTDWVYTRNLHHNIRDRFAPNVETLATLSVQDSGTGMSRDVINRLFEPFFSTKGAGRGMGMSVAAGVVRAHKGSIDIQSAPGAGTTVTVYIPMNRSALLHANEREGSTVIASIESQTILIVDDEPTLRNLIARTLNHYGFQTHVANTGEVALKMLREGLEVDLIMLDLSMPERDGLDIYTELQHSFPKPKVLLMSGYNEQAITARLGARTISPTFLHKPFRANDLLAMVRKALGR
jgi:PAS domain S-box-containing protein